jgi:helix-turn-helix protein
MQSGNDNDEKQPRKQSAFTIMNNVRDLCEQSDAKKVFLFTLATYCNGDGICYPSNHELVRTTRKSERQVQRMLKQLEAAGDLEKLTSGVGRYQKRIISLKRYAAKPDKDVTCKPDKVLSPLNPTRSLGKTSQNNHNNDNSQEQPERGIALGNSTPSSSSNGKPQSGFVFEGYQNQPVQNHVKWPEFAAWCRSKGGTPSENGFWKWLLGQKPQWRNRVKQVVEEPGYVLDGQFLTAEEANRRGVESPALLTRFRKAVKRGGKIIVDETRA